MSRRLRSLLVIAASVPAVLLSAALLTAQESGSRSTVPRAPDGKPDISGVWQIPYTPDMFRGVFASPDEIPYTEWGRRNWENYDEEVFDSTKHCLPAGLTRLMNTPNPVEIFQAPGRVAFLFEGFDTFHVVPADGRGFPEEIFATWMGTSIGRWEGDTFVMETKGFNEKTRLDTRGHPHSDQMHLTQRFTRADEMRMEYEITVDDPKTYTRPWKNSRVFTLRPDWELIEYSCMENNKHLLDGHENEKVDP